MPSNDNIKILKNVHQNKEMRELISALVTDSDSQNSVITALQGEVINGVSVANDGATNTVKVTIQKENETTEESNTLTITQPSE